MLNIKVFSALQGLMAHIRQQPTLEFMPSPRSVIKKNLKDEAGSSKVVVAALPVYRWTYV
jgi:hypothetical protein